MDKLKLNIQRFAADPPTSGNLIDEECLYEYHQNIETYYAKKSSLATVATSGSYNDLSDQPTIPTVPKIAHGQVAFTSVSSGSYKDVDIDYSSAGFTSEPNIALGLEGNGSGSAHGASIPSVVHNSLSTTGCTLRYYNASSSTLTNYVNWIAVGD